VSDDLLDFLDNLDDVSAGDSSGNTQSTDDSGIDGDMLLEDDPLTGSSDGTQFEQENINGAGTMDVSGHFQKILDIAAIDEEKKRILSGAISRLKIAADFSALDEPGKKALKDVNTIYTEAFKNISLRAASGKLTLDQNIRTFLLYGFLSEVFAGQNLKSFLPGDDSLLENNINIMPLAKWLKLLYKNEEYPSISELGVDFQKFIRERERTASAKQKADLDAMTEEDKANERVVYELSNMVRAVSRLIVPSGAHSPLFLAESSNANPAGSLVTAKKIKTIVNEIKFYDYSIFYRETLYKLSTTTNEFVQVEAEPYFIILPIAGDKVFFWQEFSSNKKNSRARIMLPVFFTGDLRKALISALAKYRWELCRSIKGNLWTDPVEGGLTGAFYDYITCYKKNPKLSFEAKEKIEDVIKMKRKDFKRIFELYYIYWIEFERKGIMKLDKAAREILFKFCPFNKDINKILEKLPGYKDLVNRHKNISLKTIERLEAKYSKKRDEQGNLPPELQSNISFYSM